MAAAVSMRWRRILDDDIHGLHPLKLQFLMFPVLQAFNFSTNSYLLYQNKGLSKYRMAECVASYLLGISGLAHANLTNALFRNSHTTTSSRMSFANLFAIDNDTDRGEADRAAEMRGDKIQYDPEGDIALEGKLLPLVSNEELSPLLAKDFRGVPATYVITGGVDVLRDDGTLFARRLRQSGQVPVVQHRNYPQLGHNSGLSAVIERDWIQFLERHPVW